MDETGQHIIGAQQYIVDIKDESKATETYSMLSNLQSTDVEPLIGRLLDQYHEETSVFQFNEVVLDLGSISPENFENELLFKIEEKLAEFLARNITGTGHLRSGKKLSIADHRIEQFRHFLLYGFIKWKSNGVQNPHHLLRELTQDEPSTLAAELNVLGVKKSVRTRMIHRFNEEELEAIVETVVPAQHHYIIAYKRATLSQYETTAKSETSFSGFRNAVWEVILAYLFEERKNYTDKRAFLRLLITRVSSRYNRSYVSFLEQMVEGLKPTKGVEDKEDFLQIIRELRDEAISTSPQDVFETENDVELFFGALSQYVTEGKLDRELTTRFVHLSAFRSTFNYFLGNHARRYSREVKKWFDIPERYKRLRNLLDETSFRRIQSHYNLREVGEALSFLRKMNFYESKVEVSLRSVIQDVERRSHELAFDVFLFKRNATPLEVRQNMVEVLLENYNRSKVQLIALVRLALGQLSNVQRTQMEKVLTKHEAQTHGVRVNYVENRANEIVEFAQSDPSTFASWLERNLDQWISEMQQDSDGFLDALDHELQKKFIAPEYLDRLRQAIRKVKKRKKVLSGSSKDILVEARQSNAYYFLREMWEQVKELLASSKNQQNTLVRVSSLISDVSARFRVDRNEVLEQLILTADKGSFEAVELNKLRSETGALLLDQRPNNQQSLAAIEYVILQGKMPWWDLGYSQYRFNTELLASWSDQSKKAEVIQWLRDSADDMRWVEYLDQTTLKELWLELDLSVTKQLSEFLIQFQELQIRYGGSGGKVSLLELHRSITRILLGKSRASHVLLLETFLKRFLVQPEVVNSQGYYSPMRELMVQIREVVDSRTNNIIESWLDQDLGIDISDNYTQFLANKRKGFKGLEAELVSVVDQLPEQKFRKHLLQNSVRQEVLHTLSEAKLQEIVFQRITNEQQRIYYQQAIAVIDGTKNVLTQKEWRALKTSVHDLILLAIAKNQTGAMTEEDWRRLVLINLKQKTTRVKYDLIVEQISSRHLETSGPVKHKDLGLAIYLAQERETFFKGNTALSKEFGRENSPENRVPNDNHVSYKAEKALVKDREANQNEEESPYKKLGEEAQFEFTDPMIVEQAGITLLAPYLGVLFERAGCMVSGKFVDQENAYVAVHLLQFAATGEDVSETTNTTLHKVLCGLSPAETIDHNLRITDEQKDLVDDLLRAVIQNWSGLGGTSIQGLRESFLQRMGRIEDDEGRYYLKVEGRAFDMLLDRIPWNITQIKLSWMQKMVFVEWRN